MIATDMLLPDAIGPLSALILVAVSLLGSLVSAAAGLGGGVLLLSVMANLVPPLALIPVHGVVQIGSNLGRTMLMRNHVDASLLPPFIVGSLIGAAVGGVVAVEIPGAYLRLGVGLFVLYSVWGPKPPALGGKAVLLSGILSSFLTMFFGATGPFVAAVWKQIVTERMAFVAVHAASMVFQHTIKIVMFAVLGFAFAPYWPLIAAMMLAGFLGSYLGKRLLIRITDKVFGHALNLVLTALALRLVWIGVEALI